MADAFQLVTQRLRSGRIGTYRRRVSPGAAGRLYEFDGLKFLAHGEQLCRDRGLATSSRNIARILGVSPRTVVRWRNGHGTSVMLATADRITNNTGAYLEDFTREAAT